MILLAAGKGSWHHCRDALVYSTKHRSAAARLSGKLYLRDHLGRTNLTSTRAQELCNILDLCLGSLALLYVGPRGFKPIKELNVETIRGGSNTWDSGNTIINYGRISNFWCRDSVIFSLVFGLYRDCYTLWKKIGGYTRVKNLLPVSTTLRRLTVLSEQKKLSEKDKSYLRKILRTFFSLKRNNNNTRPLQPRSLAAIFNYANLFAAGKNNGWGITTDIYRLRPPGFFQWCAANPAYAKQWKRIVK